MNQPIKWLTKKIKVSELKEFDQNPRRISKKDFERLVNDIRQDGYRNRIIVNDDCTILGGHSRKKALLEAGFLFDDEIEVLYPSRSLSDEEFKRINIRDNLPFGEFDFDMLGNLIDADQLIEWGMPSEWLPEGDHIVDTNEMVEQPEKKICKQCPYSLRSGDEEKVTS